MFGYLCGDVVVMMWDIVFWIVLMLKSFFVVIVLVLCDCGVFDLYVLIMEYVL